VSQLNLPSDDDIFDSVSVTQRALSEYMEQQNHINMYQSRLQNSGYEQNLMIHYFKIIELIILYV